VRTGGLLADVRAVFFDAVGTLIAPDPPAPEAYAAVGRRHGSRPEVATVRERFRAAFQREEEHDRANGWRTGDQREERRWRSIVAAVLDDVTDAEACFRELWDHFAHPSAWACLPGAGPVLAELARRGLTLGIASNYDRRLRSVAAGLPQLAPIQHMVISAEVGWRKPAAAFFDAVVRAAGCAPGEVLLVGDDFENDYEGALAAGLRAVMLDPHNRARAVVNRVVELGNLMDWTDVGDSASPHRV
jgi:putative hydrolase of the HAD superfamily